MPTSTRSTTGVWLLRALAALALGIATTIAVAWYLAARISICGGDQLMEQDQSFAGGTWSVNRFTPPPFTRGVIPAPDADPPALRLVILWQPHNDRSRGEHIAFDVLTLEARSMVRERQRRLSPPAASARNAKVPDLAWDVRGWPWPALACHWEFPNGLRESPRLLSGGIPLSEDPTAVPNAPFMSCRALPCVPCLWGWLGADGARGGFLYDTAFYAAIWFVLLFALPITRQLLRARRTRRGLCPRCAYDRTGIAGTNPCPECGDVPFPSATDSRLASPPTNPATVASA